MTTEAGAGPATAQTAQAEVACRPVEIRSRFVTAIVLRSADPLDEACLQALDRQLQQAPHFFVNAPIVVDLEPAESLRDRADFMKLAHRLRSRRLHVFGVQNGTERQRIEANGAGLVALPKGAERAVDTEPRQDKTPREATAAPAGSLLITEPVRSGQVIFADRGDLIVVAPVSTGAELVAAGSIHVYGRLSGRALAGVNGDQTARIFCQSLDADLIAIAGLYRASEDVETALRGRAIQAFLEDDHLRMTPLR